MYCPNDNNDMELKELTTEYKGVILDYETFVCPVCGTKVGTIGQTSELQKKMMKVLLDECENITSINL